MWAIWRCCGVAVLRCCGKAVGGQSGLVSGSGCGSGLLVPRQKPGQPQRSHHLRGGVDANGEVALCKPGGPLAHRQLAPGKLPHQRVLQRVLFGSAFHSSQLPNSGGEQRTTLREHSINRNPGLVRRLSLHDVMESWKWKIYEMRWECIRESSTTTTNCTWIHAIDAGEEWCPDNRADCLQSTRSAERQKFGTLDELLQ